MSRDLRNPLLSAMVTSLRLSWHRKDETFSLSGRITPIFHNASLQRVRVLYGPCTVKPRSLSLPPGAVSEVLLLRGQFLRDLPSSVWSTMPALHSISYPIWPPTASGTSWQPLNVSPLPIHSSPVLDTVSVIEPFRKAAAELYFDDLVSPIGTGKEG